MQKKTPPRGAALCGYCRFWRDYLADAFQASVIDADKYKKIFLRYSAAL
jgi:hypothetical protein